MPLAARHATASSSSFATKNAGVAPRRLRVVAARPPADANDDGAKKKKAKTTYEVKVTTPPERSLGTHRFPANTHCGDTIELRNRYFVVDKVAYHYKLERGKYRKDDSRLYVQEATRFLLNKHLDSLLEKSGGAVDGRAPGRREERDDGNNGNGSGGGEDGDGDGGTDGEQTS